MSMNDYIFRDGFTEEAIKDWGEYTKRMIEDKIQMRVSYYRRKSMFWHCVDDLGLFPIFSNPSENALSHQLQLHAEMMKSLSEVSGIPKEYHNVPIVYGTGGEVPPKEIYGVWTSIPIKRVDL